VDSTNTVAGQRSIVIVSLAGQDTVTGPGPSYNYGPRVGPAQGIGITGTPAETDVLVQAALPTFRATITTELDRGLTDQEIRDANPGFVDLAGTTGADLIAAWNAGDRNLILLNDRQYDWSDIGLNNVTPTLGVQLVGLNGADVIAGIPAGEPGANAKNVGQRVFLIRGDLKLEGIKFRDGPIPFSAIGLANTVASVDIQYCEWENVGAGGLHHELGAGIDPNLEITALTISRNKFTNVRDGVHMRMGQGQGLANGKIGALTMQYNHVDGWDRYGLVVDFDNVPTAAVWPVPGSTATVSDCLVENATTATGNGYVHNFSALEDAQLDRFWAVNNSRGGSGFDHEGAYTKNKTYRVSDSVFWNTGQNDFQGIVGLKGEDADNPTKLGLAEVEYCLIGHTQGDTDRAIHVQRSNADVHHNVIIVASDGQCLAQQTVSEYSTFQFFDNLCRMFSTNANPGAQVSGDLPNWDFDDNVWQSYVDVTHSVYRLVTQTVEGRDIDSTTIDGDSFEKFGDGNCTAILIETRAPGEVITPVFDGLTLANIDKALRLIDGDTTGAVTLQNSSHTGVTPVIENNTGSTVTTSGNTF
ncbi:MAG: hypothetical protein OEU92_09590, partial [Alphaproteobacteria bacterium]|nr:hypothetical protein [Alphaproteobacteria bacterium]